MQVPSDFAKMDRSLQIHLGTRALENFHVSSNLHALCAL
jgi:hypothetical protein